MAKTVAGGRVGLSNSDIATRLFTSVRTVESHMLQARAKLGAARRSELGAHLGGVGDRLRDIA